jgi:hypothetical protein
MALGTFRSADIARQLIMAAAYGNLSVKYATILLPATTAQNNTCDFLEMPSGTRIMDCLVRLTAAAAGVVTFQLGIAQKPGKLTTKVDDDALLTAVAISTAANFRRRNNAAVGNTALTLDDTYIIQGLIGAAALGATPVTVDLELFYEYLGTA